MTDYWKSNAMVLCKYCKIYIADEINQKRQHDEGLRHKGNVDRYIKELYKRGAQQKKDRDDEAREIQRIDAAAHAAMGTSVSPSSQTIGNEPAAKRARFTVSMANYADAASMGLAPEEDEPFFLPGQKRSDQGEAGEWQVVTPAPIQTVPPTEGSSRDREPEYEDEGEAPPTHRTLKERTAVLDDDLYDPGEIKVRRKPGESRVKKEEEASVVEAPVPRATFRPIRFGTKEEIPPAPAPLPPPVPEEGLRPDQTASSTATAAILEELPEEKPMIKAEDPEPSLFKKRKRKV